MKELRIGDQGTWVQYVQLALSRAGYAINIDGVFGERTCAALRDFFRYGEDEGCVVTEKAWEQLMPYIKGYTSHQIVAGDTIWNLAGSYASSVQRILLANPTVDPGRLQIGGRLVIPFDYPVVSREVRYSSQLNDWVLEGLLVRYPFLVQRTIGRSVLGRPLSVLQIGEGDKEVFYSASYHANEWITTPVLLAFAEDYAEAHSRGQVLGGVPAKWLYYGYRLSLLPLVNPDGVDLVNGTLDDAEALAKAGRISAGYPGIPFPQGWKANIDGIDLNLQFPAGWEQSKRIKEAQGYTSPAPRDYVGPSPLSAPESLAVYNFTREQDFLLILAYHTQGEVIYWKYLDYEPENSRAIAAYFGEVSGYTVELTPSASGYAGYKDWFILEFDRPGYTIEVGRGQNPLPMTQFGQIYEDNLGILLGGMTQV